PGPKRGAARTRPSSAHPVDGVDEGAELLADESPPDLSGRGHLAVVLVQLLREDPEGANLLRPRQVCIRLLDRLLHELLDLWLGRQIDVLRVADLPAKCPVAHNLEIDLDQGRDELP